MRSGRFVATASVLIFVIFLIGRTYSVFKRPSTSFDTLIYVSLLHHGSQDAYRSAIRTCPLALPNPAVNCTANGISNAFPIVSAYSPHDYATFIRFYTVKPLYVWTVAAMKYTLHLEDFMALRAVSTLSYLLLGIVIALWLRKHLPPPLACLLSALILSIPSVLRLGSYLLPDCFSTALILLVLYLVQYKAKSLVPQLLLLATLPFARSDNILFCVVYGAILIYRKRPSRKSLLIASAQFFLACVLLNTLLQKFTHALAYPVLFNSSFKGMMPPALFASQRLDLHFYLHTILVNGYITFASFLVVPAIFALFVALSAKTWTSLRDLVAASTFVLVARLALFPGMEERYYVWYLLISVLCATAALGQPNRQSLPVV